MTYVFAVLALTVAVIIHELGHAFMMREHGIAIKRFGIGWPIIPVFLGIRVNNFAPVHIHPVLIGAYVEPESNDDIESLPYSCQDEISAEGVFWNMATAAALFVVFSFLKGNFMWPSIIAVVAVTAFYFRSWLTSIVPLLGLALVGFVIYIIVNASGADEGGASVMGPVGIVNMLGSSSSSFLASLFLISLMLGTTNMIPIPPLDGGRIFKTFLERIRAPRIIIDGLSVAGVVMIVGILIFATVGDIGRVFP